MALAGWAGVTVPLLLLLRWPGLLAAAEQVALLEVYLEHRPGVSALLRGQVVESSRRDKSSEPRVEDQEELEGNLVLVGLPGQDEEPDGILVSYHFIVFVSIR